MRGHQDISVTDRQAFEDEMERLSRDVGYMGETALEIMNDKLLTRTKLELSESQKTLIAVRNRIVLHGQPVRIVALKSRQVYFSTATAAMGFQDLYFSDEERRHTLISYKWPSVKEIMEMNWKFAEHLPEWMRRKWSANRGEPFTFRWEDTGAGIDSLSGEASDPGRGGNRYFLHASEVALYRDPVALMNAVMPSVPDQPGTTIIFETTARGYDRFFQPRWVDAVERVKGMCRIMGAVDEMDLLFNRTGWGNGKYPRGYWPGGWFPVFMPWFAMPKYVKDPALVGITMENLTRLERVIMKQHGLSLQQMAFRRFRVNELGGNRIYHDDDPYIREFNQEMPDTPENAFKNTGDTFLPATTITFGAGLADIKAREVYEVEGKRRRVLQPCGIRWAKGHEPRYNSFLECINRHELRPRVFPAAPSELTIWKTPFRDPIYNRKVIENGKTRIIGSRTWNYRYVIGCDISEGGVVKGDWSVAYVLDRVLWEFVAQFRGRPTPLEFAEILALLGYYYDDAWIMGEYNDQGPSVVPRLESIYTNVCDRPEISAGRGDVMDDRKWFLTSPKSKRLLADYMRESIEAKPAMMPFPEFWTDAKVFVQGEDWKLGAEGKQRDKGVKNYDDCMIAAGQAIVGHMYSPKPVENFIPQNATERLKEQFARTHNIGGRALVDNLPAGIKASKVL